MKNNHLPKSPYALGETIKALNYLKGGEVGGLESVPLC